MYNNIITKTNIFTRLLKKLIAIPVLLFFRRVGHFEHLQHAFQGGKTRTVYVDAIIGDVVLKPYGAAC